MPPSVIRIQRNSPPVILPKDVMGHVWEECTITYLYKYIEDSGFGFVCSVCESHYMARKLHETYPFGSCEENMRRNICQNVHEE